MNEAADSEARAEARRAARGAFWAGVGQWGGSALSIVTLAITARLLGPGAFGVNALAAALTAPGAILVSGTLAEALIQRRNLTDAERRTGFWIAAPLGIVLFLGFAFVASLMTGETARILPAVALGLPIAAFASAPVALLMREMRFKALSLVELAAGCASSLTGVGLAILGFGVWTLVTMELVRAGLRCVGVFALTRLTPGRPPPWSAFRSVMAFGASGLGVEALALVDKTLPRLVIGGVLGTEALGVFTLANRLFTTLSQLALGPLSAVAMSTVARLQHNLPALRQLVATSMRLTTTIAAPGYLGLAAIAPVLIPTVFGADWSPAVAPAQILLLLGLRTSASGFNIAVLRGVGRNGAPLVTMGIGAILTAVLVPLAAPFGVLAVCLAMLLRGLATWPLSTGYLSQAIGLSLKEQSKAGGPAVAASLLMAAVVSLFVYLARGGVEDIVLIPAGILLGVLVYASLLQLVAPSLLRGAFARLTQRRKVDARSGRF